MAPIAAIDIPERVVGALREASRRTGEGFDYLLKTAMRESGLAAGAQAPTSSAAGLFQFVEQTWLESVKEWGPTYGLQSFADDISRDADGTYQVADPDARAAILALRGDPKISALMAGELAKSNRAELARRLGREPTEGELYIGHFLGAAGGARLIAAAAGDPDRSAAAMFPRAAGANRAIFYDASGAPRGAAGVYAELVRLHGGAGDARPAAPARSPMAGLFAFFERLFIGAPRAAATPAAGAALAATEGAGGRAAALSAATAYRVQAARMPSEAAPALRGAMDAEPRAVPVALRAGLWLQSLFTNARPTGPLPDGLGLRRTI